MDQISIDVEPRTALGKKNRALRRSGKLPVHVYGLKEEPLSLQADTDAVRLAVREAGVTTPVTVKVKGGGETVTMIREVARHPVSGTLLHVDFMRVSVQQEIEAMVPITLFNAENAAGTRGGAGVVTQGLYDVNLRARPFDMPSSIEVDCSVLVDLEAMIRTSDLSLPTGVALAGDPDVQVAWVQPPRVVEEVTPAAAEGEVEQGAEGAEAAAGGSTE